MALTLSDVKFWEAMSEEISIHTDFFVWHLKIALPSFCGIPTNASIIFSTFRATNSRSSEVKCKFVFSNVPQGFSCLILNFPRTRHIKELLWCHQPGVTCFLKELYFHHRGRLYFRGWSEEVGHAPNCIMGQHYNMLQFTRALVLFGPLNWRPKIR